MESTALFEMALGLTGGWKVVKSEFQGEPKKLEIYLDFAPGSKFGCPECGEPSGVHDTVEKRWRHLNFLQHECELIARVPRVKCERHGVRQVVVPWAKPGSGFTLLFEAAVMMLVKEMPVAVVEEMLGEVDTHLWRLVMEQVEQAHQHSDWSEVRAIDETSVRKGWNYVTVIIDAETRRLLHLAPRRSGEALRNQVRKRLQAEGADLKGSLWARRGNEWNQREDQRVVRTDLARRYKRLGRALALRNVLQDVYTSSEAEGPALLAWWCCRAKRSRLQPFARLAATIFRLEHGIIQMRINQQKLLTTENTVQIAL